MDSTGHKQVKPVMDVPEPPHSKRPLALTFLKNDKLDEEET